MTIKPTNTKVSFCGLTEEELLKVVKKSNEMQKEVMDTKVEERVSKCIQAKPNENNSQAQSSVQVEERGWKEKKEIKIWDIQNLGEMLEDIMEVQLLILKKLKGE